jgi:hypothetical protein
VFTVAGQAAGAVNIFALKNTTGQQHYHDVASLAGRWWLLPGNAHRWSGDGLCPLFLRHKPQRRLRRLIPVMNVSHSRSHQVVWA